MRVMTYEPPADLVQLRRDFNAAEAEWGAAGQRGDQDAATAAYRDVQRLTGALQRHEWWTTVENRFEARMALLAAAKA
jgi:hypothetical protein